MKYGKLFENFLLEASYATRAWSNKLSNIDKLLSWMYDKNIMNKTEKAEKDVKFRKYYRYYNDGDFPIGLTNKNGEKVYSGMADSVIKNALEYDIEKFIKKILSKYSTKIDRKEFYVDTFLSDLQTLSGIIKNTSVHSLINYWSKKIDTKDSMFSEEIIKLEEKYKEFQTELSKVSADKKGYEVAYVRTLMKNNGEWTPELNTLFNEMTDILKKLGDIVENTIDVTKKLKTEKVI